MHPHNKGKCIIVVAQFPPAAPKINQALIYVACSILINVTHPQILVARAVSKTLELHSLNLVCALTVVNMRAMVYWIP